MECVCSRLPGDAMFRHSSPRSQPYALVAAPICAGDAERFASPTATPGARPESTPLLPRRKRPLQLVMKVFARLGPQQPPLGA